MTRILVVDDDAASRRLIEAIFRATDIHVTTAPDGPSALAMFRDVAPDVVLLDLQMPVMDGLEVLEKLREIDDALPIVMLTAERDVKTAVRAIQRGAFDFLGKPVDQDELMMVVKRAAETHALRAEVAELRKQVSGGSLASQMGYSLPIQRIVEQVGTVATTMFSVLILGETGTGKELVAQALHKQSDRRTQPFVALDCGAIPEPLLESELFGHEKGAFTGADRRKRGQFDLAGGGTIFLDEVGNLPIGLQAKLLRVLEARQVQPIGGTVAVPVDVRFIAATNEDLQRRVADGRFRADLYFRLAQYTVRLPPLRERREDIQTLSNRFLEEVCIELKRPVQSIAPEALEALERHDWPGNVRELRNVIRQAVLESKTALLGKPAVSHFLGRESSKSIPNARVPGRSLKETAEAAARDAERDLIVATLRATNGNKSQAARELQTDYKTLHVKMKALGIRANDFGDA
ncbi:MAG TPA: sigma-54 dependent transcriptional regulator [Kofleriaceae bacterium]|jgi:DNA-binding NtrC family response regulator